MELTPVAPHFGAAAGGLDDFNGVNLGVICFTSDFCLDFCPLNSLFKHFIQTPRSKMLDWTYQFATFAFEHWAFVDSSSPTFQSLFFK